MKEFCRKRQLRWSGKRWLAVLLSVCLMGTMIPVTARAETGETQESGYEQEEENASVSENDTADNESEDGEDTPDNESEDEEDTPDNTSEPEDDPAPSDDEEQTKPEEKDEVEDETAIIITSWQWIDEEECLDPEIGSLSLPGANKNNPASFEDITAFLPTRILATVENAEAEDTEAEDTEAGDGEETITLGDWECDNYPEEGAYQGHYTFTAALPEGYALSGEADALEVLVELGGAQMYETMQTASDFTITGGKNGTDYTYADGVLTIKTSTPITIANADPNATTNDRIEVAGGVSATITLDGVNIDVSSSRGTAAFKIADDSTGNVTITLADSSENKLKSGMNCAGLQKNGAYSETLGKLTIQGGENGTGKLAATGKSFGAGIGGGDDGSGSNIEITGGTVTATGGLEGAGIGGGSGGSGSDITISGGTVTANGGDEGAGIGGGSGGSGSDITISGGTVTANGDRCGAGIGGGYYGFGSDIEISGGNVIAKGKSGAGIGGGYSGSGSNIKISDCTVTANGGNSGAGIGGGYGGSGSNIEISGCTVTATSDMYGAGIGGGHHSSGSNIKISGGSVKAAGANAIGGGERGNGAVPPTSDGTTPVYLLEIPNPGSEAVLIDGVSYTPVNHKAVDESDGNLYAYLPGKGHAVKVGEKTSTYVFDSANSTFAVAPLTVYATDGGALTYDTDYTYTDGVLTIKSDKAVTISGKTTTDTIVVEKDKDANITLDGVNIDVSGTDDEENGNVGSAAFKIADDSTGNVTITLADGSENTLISGYNCAGLQKNGGTSTGTLTIKGGENGTGTLNATGGGNGAGIGGGDAAGSNITISGGTVTATGGANGGTGIGGGYNGEGSDIEITGGSVKAVAGKDANAIGGGRDKDAVTPTNGTNEVYLLTIENPDSEDVYIDDASYTPVNHKAVDSNDGNLYAYLPAKDSLSDPLVVKVGTETTKYIYDTKWLIVSTAPVTAPMPNKLVYTGAAQDLVTAGTTSYGTMVYSLDENGTYTTAIPTGTDADTYTVWYKVKDGEVYADTLPASVEVTIEPAAPVITNANTVENQSTVYGSGEFVAPTAAVEGTVTYKVGETTYTGEGLKTYLAGKSVNDFPVAVEYTFTPTGTTNYKEVTGTISFTIEKATPCIKEAPTAAAITYGNTLGDSALSDGIVQHSDSKQTIVTGSFAWADSSVKPSVADSGTTFYQVVFTPSGADAVNYTTAETKVTLTVNKAEKAPNMPSSAMEVPYRCEKVSEVALPEDWVWQEADKDKELPIDTQVTATAVYDGADKGNYEKETVSVSITRPEISNDLWIEEISDQTYNGKAIKPEVWVYYDRQLLTAGKDYTVSYKNNTNAAAADAVNTKGASIAPTVTVKGKGNFSGTVTQRFTILPINLDNYKTDAQLQEILTIEPVYAKYTGKFIKATPTVKLNGKKLALSAKQYTCEYNDGNLPDKEAYTDCGTYNITIVGSKKNFVGETTVTETISGELISKATITLDRSSYPYDRETGETFPAKVTVKYGRNTLTEGTDYTVSYKNYDKIGTATVIITGMGNYSGVKTKTYKITGTKLTTRMVTQINKSFPYDGKEHSVVQGTDYKIADGTTGLMEGKHYTVSYKGDRTKAGTFKVTFTGIGAYSGTVTKTFTIQKASVSSLDVTLPDGDSVFYTKGGVKPKPEVRFKGVLLTEGTDYTVTYQNNTKAASAEDKKAPCLYITGKGGFTGNTKATPMKFTIRQAPLAAQNIVIDNVPYKNRNGNYVPAITITDSTTGKKLAKNTDYLGSFTYDIWDTAAGSFVPFTGKKVEASEDNIRMRVTVSAKGSYTGEASVEYEICPKSITTVKVAKIPNQEYTGKEITPELTITDNGVELIEGTHYTLEYSNNIKKGTATVTIRGKGQYGGSRTVKFKITSRIFEWL